MKELKFTLIGDGSSDKALMNIINWLLDDVYPKLSKNGTYADFRGITNPPKKGDIYNQIDYAKKYYPFDILFYHRDAETKEKKIIQLRKNEIFSKVNGIIDDELIVCIIPVVMMESWLLFDELAIKKAAENRNYNQKIELPKLNKIETLIDPKTTLHNILKQVSCKKKRNLDKFNLNYAVHLVSDNIIDFKKLRILSSFQEFENDLKKCVEKFTNSQF